MTQAPEAGNVRDRRFFTRTLSRKLLAPWWLFPVTGIGWMLVALIVLRYDYKSVNAIAVGAFAVIRGVMDIVLAFRVHALQDASASA